MSPTYLACEILCSVPTQERRTILAGFPCRAEEHAIHAAWAVMAHERHTDADLDPNPEKAARPLSMARSRAKSAADLGHTLAASLMATL